MNFFFFLIMINFITTADAKVEIRPYRHHSWNNEWNEVIASEISKQKDSVMMDIIDEEDLQELGCPGLNSVATPEQKKDFWIVFLSALTRAESAFNKNARSVAPKGGHGNYGLLQLSKSTARNQCGLSSAKDISTEKEQLRCGVKLLSWQLLGAPTANGKLLRADLKGQLFGKHILLWGPLRQNDKRGRSLLVGWFKKHLDQLPFCGQV